MKVFSADWVCPASAPPVPDGTLVVSGDRILGIGVPAPEGTSVEAFPGCAIVPGFVNVHTHLELTVFRGFLENLSFSEWIRTLTRTKYQELDRDDLLASARLGAGECLAAGVTTVGEVMDAGTGLEAMTEFGLQGIAYQEVFGPAREVAGERTRELAARVEALGSRWATDLRRVGISPHAPYTVSDELYRQVGDLARASGLPMALHIGESVDEGRFVRDAAGPFADALRARGIAVTPRGMGPIAHVGRLGVLGPETLAIHAIEADGNDVRRLHDTGTAVAHCPKSNLKLGHGLAPVREFLDSGLRVGLGTDSVASNNSIDMFEEMRTAVFLQRSRLNDARAMTADEAFHMATLGGARCLGLDSRVGSLEVGKQADFVVVGLDDLALQPVYDPIATLVFSATRRNVRATFIGGRRVAHDTGPVLSECARIASRLRGGSPA